ncbi:MAG: NADH-quinone oxidoreductase subunit K [Deltaproteobacteria bacterium]|nr:NADH-quinone oxidoreductase subunit K [Deltaproteobacteria bacterium]
MSFSFILMSGILFATGIYFILRRSLLKLLFGVLFLSHAVNLIIFLSAGLHKARPAIIDNEMTQLTAPYADPLSQALILTAIVIGFAMQAFFIILIYRVYKSIGTDDIDQIRSGE